MDYNTLVGVEVVNRAFGKGIIESVEDGYIDVKFKKGKESKFAVPSCFDKFLKISDEKIQEEIQKDVIEWKEANGIFEKEKLIKKTISTQEGIKKREKERQVRRLKRAKEVAERNRMFMSNQ